MMGVFELFLNRRSIRKFKDLEISDTDIATIVDAARLAPTARNIQPWEFIVIKNKGSLKKIGELASPNGLLIANSRVCIVVVCSETKYFLEDGCAATTQALLAASALGIGSCWVAGDKKDYAEAIKSYLEIPKEYKLISLIALGYPDEVPNPEKRKLQEVMHEEKF